MTTATTALPTGRPAGSAPVRVAIVGATGYAGQELVRVLARHPHATLTMATASQATSTPRRLPALARLWEGEVVPLDPQAVLASAEVVFLALPEAASAEMGATFVAAGRRVIDLSGAFRLRDDAARARWYPATTTMPEGVVYGLTEFAGAEIPGARLVSCPGCYPTASLLALQPLFAAGLLRPGADVIIDAKSGVSGAGKAPSDRTHFCENHGSVAAYGLFGHRHTAEMVQTLGGEVTFTPHLVPLDRGILSTIYARLKPGVTAAQVDRGTAGGPRALALRAAHRRRPARDQARGLYQLLRHRLEGRRGHGPDHPGVGDRQPAQGRGRTGRAELQSAHRRGRTDRPAVSGRPVVLKFGGELLEDPARVKALARVMRRIAARVPLVVVHGGGREIDRALAGGRHRQEQVDGLRVTDAATLAGRRGGAGRHDQHAARGAAQRGPA